MRVPSYIRLYREGRLQGRIDRLLNLMSNCCLCPRQCRVDRSKDEKGVCRTGRKARVASFNAHFGEETPLVGRHGSGTIFFSSCNLLCSFCQNYEISHLEEGTDVGPAELAAMMLRLKHWGCHNINFVTPTHVTAQILESLPVAIEKGLDIPLVYNCGGYEEVETLRLLEDIVDIYMPDFKFWDDDMAGRFCHARDYREHAMAAVKEMHRQVGDLQINEAGIAERGLLVRHLVMPDDAAGSAEVMAFLAREISADTYINIMDQYRPCGTAGMDKRINRRINDREFEAARHSALSAGLHRLDIIPPGPSHANRQASR